MGKVTDKFAIISESRWDFLALPGLFSLIDPKNCYVWPYKKDYGGVKLKK